jgi:hypothetical protein
MAHELLKMAVDENVTDAVKLAAIKDALDRAGLGARTAVSVEVGSRPFEQIFDYIAGGSGVAPTTASTGPCARRHWEHPLAALAHRSGEAADPIVDAELVGPEPNGYRSACR